MYSVIKTAENMNCELVELNHAMRANGVIDIYKMGNTIYVIPENKYHKFDNQDDAKLFFELNIVKYEKRAPFKKISPNKPSYQEFKNRTTSPESIVGHAEDYHWKQNLSKTSDDHLYFIAHQGHIKIGRSKDVYKRVTELKTALSSELSVYFIKNKGCLESTMHKCFSEYRNKGEWFKQNARIVNFVRKHGEKLDIEMEKKIRKSSKKITVLK